jgi:NTP pyrophosphatase (non-canonical NTP hydrolase)
MDINYQPKTLEQALAHVVEECGEVTQALGKTFRFGLNSVNPKLPANLQETNRDMVLREINDLKNAITKLEGYLNA